MTSLARARLRWATKTRVQKPARGFLTCWAWAQKENKSQPQMRRILRELVDAKIMAVRSYVVRTGDSIRPVPHYGHRKGGKK